ncbi:MAG TPA: ATP-dependent helicase [Mycobacteriales bacterium]|nr:ATP-dependent helicase [Mycobacteriales bacterium]
MFDVNEEQRVAVDHDGGPLLVLAGAGTGKTTTLTARVARLLERGVPAHRLLLLTFTRRAAAEMLGRAAQDQRQRPWGGTFHSVAHRIIAANAAGLGLPGDFAVIDPADAADLLDVVREECGLARAGRRTPRKGLLLDLYSRSVNTGRPLSETVAETAPWAADLVEPIADVIKAYVARKRSRALLDFDDLLLYWRAAARDEVLSRRLAGLFDEVLVDEYQDVNQLQVDIVRGLCANGTALTAVGDDAQAVYGFRGASAAHILDLPDQFPGTTVVRLVRNYRSTQPILDLANAAWSGASRRYVKDLVAVRTGTARPELVDCADEATQCEQVCARVLAARERGLRLRDQAVLFRAGRGSDLLELELTRRRIPYVKYGGLRYLEAAHVKDLLALYRLADNPRDETAWFRLLQLLDGVGPATARRAVDTLELDRDGILDRWDPGVLPECARAAADRLVTALRATGPERPETLRVALAPVVQAHYPDGPARLADLERLSAAAAEHGDLRTFVVELALDPPRSTGADAVPPGVDEDWLVLSTVHSAKGLEWDVVHLLHVTEGSFPSDLGVSTADGLDEERRLFHVALTRARDSLHLYAPLRYHHHPRARDDRNSWAQRSRFLDEAALACCDRTAVEPEVAPAPALGITSSAPAARVAADLDALWV